MLRLWRVVPTVLLAVAFVIFARVNSGSSYTNPTAVQSPEVKSVTGVLKNVDSEHQTFTLKLENDEEIVFQYDQDTKVEGRESGVQGLSSDTGIQLTVYYTEEDGKNVVTKIEIKKSEG